MNITISKSAANYIEAMLKKNDGKIFRLTIKKTGCSGYSYLPTLEEKINSHDVILNVNEQLKLYVDTTWMHLLDGITVDYIEEQKSGLKQKKLVFHNPQESSRCGCGESFHIGDDRV